MTSFMEKEFGDKSFEKQDPLAHVRLMVQRHAKEMAEALSNLEDRIAVKGKELDILHKARDTAFEALRGTEKLRVDINEALGDFGTPMSQARAEG